jgi:regulator of cell morphogenesis and NO signaling
MTATTEKTVRELALENPGATRVFEKLQIDYCCGGGRTLGDACRVAGIPVESVLEALARSGPAPAEDRDWNQASLGELIDHIKSTHHAYTRDAIGRIPSLLQKVIAAHGERHPELRRIQSVFGAVAQELSTHMMKEEMVLFPFIARLEEAALAGEPAPPAPFGTVANPVRMMEHEHDTAGEALREIRSASSDFAPPADACLSFQTLYKVLAEFEADLHLHIHLENNILFPRALQLER